MRLLRKHLFPISFLVVMALFTLFITEGAHHHGALEDNDGCAVCSWQMTGSQAPSAPVPPVMLPLFLFIFTLFFRPSFFQSFVFIFPSGRSPPKNLL